MRLLRYVARPVPGSIDAEKYAGAYINCWVNEASKAKAMVVARRAIRSAGWSVEELDGVSEVERSQYEHQVTTLEMYDVAVRKGWALVIHAWLRRRRATKKKLSVRRVLPSSWQKRPARKPG